MNHSKRYEGISTWPRLVVVVTAWLVCHAAVFADPGVPGAPGDSPALAVAQSDVSPTQPKGVLPLGTNLVDEVAKNLNQVRKPTQQEPDDRVAENSAASHVKNPFTLDNLLQWALDHGPRLVGILLGTLAIYLAVKLSGKHFVALVARGTSRGSLHERENRALTLVGVLQNIASLVVLGGGALMILDELSIPILPLMGGAAVVGLAVAFGSQNLIKDYFSGFMILLEDQYGINDVVKIGSISGAVEQITLRMTVLRDLEGVVHFIPHGTITTVSNMTHGWSRALLEISVAYKEDTDHVVEVMLAVARELRADPEFGPLILDDAEMLGVDGLGDSAVLIKMVIKTQPLKRWPVRREYLRRIKRRFDELGIEIPFPHRTVYLRQDGMEETVADDGPLDKK